MVATTTAQLMQIVYPTPYQGVIRYLYFMPEQAILASATLVLGARAIATLILIHTSVSPNSVVMMAKDN